MSLLLKLTTRGSSWEGAGEAVLNNYIFHFYETIEYNCLDLYWDRVAYNDVFGRLAELHPQVDLASIREEFFLVEPSTPADEGGDSKKGVDA